MKREDVLKTAVTAIDQRLSPGSIEQLLLVAQKYKKPHNSAAVENWLGEIQDRDFVNFSKKENETWLDDWLEGLPE